MRNEERSRTLVKVDSKEGKIKRMQHITFQKRREKEMMRSSLKVVTVHLIEIIM
jgi:hypothetical protein